MFKRVIMLSALIFVSCNAWATWDEATPSGTEAKSLGDDRIRELKVDVRKAFTYEGDFPGEDTSDPKFIYTPSSGPTSSRPSGLTATATGQLFVNSSSGTVEQFNGSQWFPIASLIPSGSKMLFVNQSCPSGWTLDLSSSGRAIRVAESANLGGSGGGSTDISTGTLTLAHSHTVNSHTHDLANHTHANSSAGSTPSAQRSDLATGGAATAATASHTHTGATSDGPSTNTSGAATPGTDSQLTSLNILKYLNVIVCVAP